MLCTSVLLVMFVGNKMHIASPCGFGYIYLMHTDAVFTTPLFKETKNNNRTKIPKLTGIKQFATLHI